MTTKPCQSKNPLACRYHGSRATRMLVAAQEKNETLYKKLDKDIQENWASYSIWNPHGYPEHFSTSKHHYNASVEELANLDLEEQSWLAGDSRLLDHQAEWLAKNGNWHVREYLVRNNKLSPKILDSIVRNETSGVVLNYAFHNKNIETETLKYAVKHFEGIDKDYRDLAAYKLAQKIHQS